MKTKTLGKETKVEEQGLVIEELDTEGDFKEKESHPVALPPDMFLQLQYTRSDEIKQDPSSKFLDVVDVHEPAGTDIHESESKSRLEDG